MTLKRLIYAILQKHERVTGAGVCYLLRDLDRPPTLTEAERTLEWLVRNRRAERHPDTGMGTEYTGRNQ